MIPRISEIARVIRNNGERTVSHVMGKLLVINGILEPEDRTGADSPCHPILTQVAERISRAHLGAVGFEMWPVCPINV
jgi:hypothetical protein